MVARLLLSLAAIFCYVDLGNCRIWEIPLPESLQNCYNRANSSQVDRYVGSVYSWHCEHTLMNATYATEPIPKETTAYVTQLHDIAIKSSPTTTTPGRGKRQASNRCVRKEYRMLTAEERRRYHEAVRALKRDTSIRPNKYDAIASIHTGATNAIAHGGPGFLGWHRVYLLIYETALRQVDPRVCLPYWDSTLDSKLPDPFMSSIWTPEFLGTPRGNVREGPFANWGLPNGVQLIRNVGIDGDVLTTDIVNDILSRNSYDEIVTSQSVDPRYDLEMHHGAVHVFVGGAMTRLETAAFEPAFFMHHAFIDYIWERFRAKLRSVNVNPELYPSTFNQRHLANAPMGFSRLTHSDGYTESMAQRVTYEAVPTCSARSPSCGVGSSLVCQTSRGLCVPTTRSLTPQRRKRQAPTQDTCSIQPTTYALPNQNDFCVGPSCDTDEWVMIPVKIVNVRPPKFRKYNSYPVKRGRVDDTRDIYAPNVNDDAEKFIYIRQRNPKTYDRCKEDPAIGQIYLYSHGINYSGYYKESTIVDQKLTVSVSLGFIGVKKPSEVEGGVSRALLRAHDSCGRVCHVACRDPDSKDYTVCSGAVAVDERKPRGFGRKYDEAFTSVVDYTMDNEVPKFKVDNLYIAFYCDYRGDFPFAARKNKP